MGTLLRYEGLRQDVFRDYVKPATVIRSGGGGARVTPRAEAQVRIERDPRQELELAQERERSNQLDRHMRMIEAAKAEADRQLQEARDRVTALEHDMHDLETSFEAEVQARDARLAQEQQSASSLTDAMQKLQRALEEQKVIAGEYEKERERLQRELQAARTQYENMHREFESVKGLLERSRFDFSDCQSKWDASIKKLKECNQSFKALQAQAQENVKTITQLAYENNMLRESAQKSEVTTEQINRNMAVIKELTDLRQNNANAIAQLTTEATMLRNQLAEAESARKSVEAGLSNALAKLGQVQKKYDELYETTGDIRMEVKEQQVPVKRPLEPGQSEPKRAKEEPKQPKRERTFSEEAVGFEAVEVDLNSLFNPQPTEMNLYPTQPDADVDMKPDVKPDVKPRLFGVKPDVKPRFVDVKPDVKPRFIDVKPAAATLPALMVPPQGAVGFVKSEPFGQPAGMMKAEPLDEIGLFQSRVQTLAPDGSLERPFKDEENYFDAYGEEL